MATDTTATISKDDTEDEALVPRNAAISYGADYTLETIAQYVKNKDIDVQPGFQRKEVWDKVKASKLLESFLFGYPVPNVLLGRPQNGERMEVIDGQQRIMAISSFLRGTFKDTVFRLTGDIAPHYLNKSFDDLDEADQRRLRNSVLKATILVYQDSDPDLKFSVFQRINTGSVVLNQQEIRNCIYGGSFNNLLHNLNAETLWRDFVSKKPDSRMKDEEAILRFFAAFFNREDYEKPMTRFLNNFMRAHQNIDEPTSKSWQDIFLGALQIIKDNFSGSNPFTVTDNRQLNRAAFEAITVAVATLTEKGKTDFSDFNSKHYLLISDDEFRESVSTGTADTKKYAQRFKNALDKLA
jgi:Protein of unknown function DUF262